MIDRSIRAVNRALLAVASVGVLILAIVVFTGVVSRYVLGAPFRFVMPSTEYVLLAIVFLAMAGALQNGAHIRIEFVTEMMPPKAALIVRQIGDALGVAVSGLLCWLSVNHFTKVLNSGETDISILRIPLWTVQWLLILGFGLLTLTYLLIWLRTWKEGVTPEISPEELAAEELERLQ
jgi:TRAP-type C4-dicarboxylate transport system permease small subunit